jgi:hypothetical protein
MQKVAPELTLARTDAAALESPLPGLGGARSGLAHDLGGLRGFVSRLKDAELSLGISAVLFLVGAWPLMLTEVPPYQDLPNHLAAVTVIQHPARYPEFVFNGFFKTNAALFSWLAIVGGLVGVKMAARLFALTVLGLNALVMPRFVLELTGSRKKLVVASFFIWPMIHNWFVSMGMLDFALGVPLSLWVLVLLNRQRVAPSWRNGLAITACAALTWYAHVFTLMVVHLLVLIHVATRRRWPERIAQARALILPLLPASALVLWSLWQHVTEPVGAMTGYVDSAKLLPPWELAYNMFAEWMYGFTWLSIGSLVACLALGLIGLSRRNVAVPFFSPMALAALGVLFVLTPYIATNWFHVNSRFIPFIWMAFLLRVPERIPRLLRGALVACAATYTVGMGVDFVRLDEDRAKFTAGMAAVPEGSNLLPLVYSRKLTSENTRSLQHAWGFYVLEKQTSAPLLFAHSRSFPLMYKEPPAPQFNHLVLESFAPSMGTSTWMCDVLRSGGVFVNDCEAEWRARWAEFWQQALPEYDHVLTWDAPPEARALMPSRYHVVFSQDRLTVYERDDSRVTAHR